MRLLCTVLLLTLGIGPAIAAPLPRLVLAPGLENRRGEFRKTLERADARLERFAGRYGWSAEVRTPLVEQVEVVQDKAAFDLRVAPGQTVPRTFVAAVVGSAFLSVPPEDFAVCVPEMQEPGGYEKLWCHELIHRLHVRILAGNEDQMGPVWFYEGLAVLGADQFSGSGPPLSADELWTIVQSPKRGSYAKYRQVLEHFLARTPLPELVREAARPDFADLLRRRDQEPRT